LARTGKLGAQSLLQREMFMQSARCLGPITVLIPNLLMLSRASSYKCGRLKKANWASRYVKTQL